MLSVIHMIYLYQCCVLSAFASCLLWPQCKSVLKVDMKATHVSLTAWQSSNSLVITFLIYTDLLVTLAHESMLSRRSQGMQCML